MPKWWPGKGSDRFEYLALGDSITAGQGADHPGKTDYVAQLAVAVARTTQSARFHLFQRGRQGQTSRQLRKAVSRDIGHRRPSLISILIGTNDVIGYGNYAVDAVEFATNLIEIVEACLRVTPTPSIAIATLPYIANYDWSGDGVPFGSEERRREFNQAIAGVANHYQLYLVTLAEAFDAAGGLLQADGVHPNQQGHDLICRRFWLTLPEAAFS